MPAPQVTSFGTPTLVRATSGSITGTWGTGQNRTAGHLLVAVVTAGGTTASAAAISTPAGWMQRIVVGNTATSANTWAAIYTATAAGSDAAPSFTATLTGTVAMTCTLLELPAAALLAPVDTSGTYASGGSSGSLTSMPATTVNPVSVAGAYAIGVFVQEAAAATNTWTPGTSWTNLVNDGTTSTVLHTAVDFFANPTSGSALSESGAWTTHASAFGAGIVLVVAPQTGGIELYTNDASTTITSGGTSAPAAGTPELWTAASWSSFATASPSTTPPTKIHIADPALPGELIEVLNTSTGLVVRGAQGTTPVAHAASFTVQNVYPAGWAGSLDQEYNVRSVQFGAKGDGSTDDTAAFRAAIQAAHTAGGGEICIPPGTYKITPVSATVPALTIPSNVILRGAGIGATTLLKNGNGILLDFSGTGPISQTTAWNVYQGLHDLAINGNGATGLLIRLYYVQFYNESNVYLYNNAEVFVDMAQCFDSRVDNGLYLDGGSASTSAVSGAQACTHLIRNSAAPTTTLSAGISGTVTALPVAALPAALPAGIVQVWNAAGELQNFTTTGAAAAATSIPVTSTTVAHSFVTGNAVNGFGYSGDSTNALIMRGCHWEGGLSGALWLTPGVNNTGLLNEIYIIGSKVEEDSIGFNAPIIQVDPGCSGIHIDHMYLYTGAFNGGFSTPVTGIYFHPDYGTLSNVEQDNGAVAVISTGIDAGTLAGFRVMMTNIFQYWNSSPTVAGFNGSAGTTFLLNFQMNGTVTTYFTGTYTLINDGNGDWEFIGQGTIGQTFVYSDMLFNAQSAPTGTASFSSVYADSSSMLSTVNPSGLAGRIEKTLAQGSVTVANTASATAIATATIKANDPITDAVYRITLWGLASTTSAPTLTFSLLWGGTTLITGTAITMGSSVANQQFTVTAEVHFTSTTQCAAINTIETSIVTNAQASPARAIHQAAPATVTVASDQAFNLTAKWSAASASNTLTAYYTVERVA